MGQKVNPVGFRVGTFKPWMSRWFRDDKTYKDYLIEDISIRKLLMERLHVAGIASVDIARLSNSMVVTLTVSRPGVVIGRGGSGIEDIKKEIVKSIEEIRSERLRDMKIDIQVQEIKNADLSAQLVAARIVGELERRMPHRRVVSRTIERVMGSGALGIKIVLSGRIGGAEISRTEKYHDGAVPTQTLRANIDYAQMPALLKRGYVGVKVWINRPKDE